MNEYKLVLETSTQKSHFENIKLKVLKDYLIKVKLENGITKQFELRAADLEAAKEKARKYLYNAPGRMEIFEKVEK